MISRTGFSLGVLATAALVAFVLVLGLAGLFSGMALATGTILHVKPEATGDCASWSNACGLQTALGKAQSGDQVWVAGGTYYPTSGTDRTATFRLESGVALYGGFSGNETGLEGRNWRTNVTTLSGDIGTGADASDNAYHVVTGSGTDGTAILDGFTVTGGNANGSQDSDGGGMYNSGGSPTVRNSEFTKNSAVDRGGSMVNLDNSNPEISNVTFRDSSSRSGGGMLNLSSNPSLTNVFFFQNKVTAPQGSATNGIFAAGGGLYNMESSPRLVNVTFFANTSTGYGGGVYNSGKHPFRGDFTFAGAVFALNTASLGGGGMYNGGASPTVVNSTFWKNGVTNASFGGGISNDFDSSPAITNTILWANNATGSGKEIHNGGGSNPRISFSLIKDSGGSGSGWSSALGADGGNNIASDPKFESLSGNMRLQSGSPAIDAGDNASVPAYLTKDLDGRARIANERVDMGAYESRSPNPEVSLPESVNYGDQTAGSNTTRRASLSNSGGQSLIFYSARITGANADQFSIDAINPNRCRQNQSLGPDFGCGVYVTFAPTSSGEKRARLEIQTNAASSPDTVELVGTGLNRPPTAVNDAAQTNENTPTTISVLANDTDPDRDPLTVSGISTPAHGSAQVNTGKTGVTYTPSNGYSGVDSFTYTVSDGKGGTTTATVSVTVKDKTSPAANVNVSPQPNVAGWNNSDVTLTISATDNAGGSGVEEITYEATADPNLGGQTNGSTTVTGSSVELGISTEGQTTVIYSAKDKDGNVSGPKTVTVKLDKTAPDISIDSGPDGPTDEGTPTFTFVGTDNLTAAGDLLYSYKLDDDSWSDYSDQTSVTLGGSAGLSDGEHTLYVKTKDVAGNEDQSQRNFLVDTTPPTADEQSVEVSEDETEKITLTGSDSRFDTVGFKILSLPAHGKLYEGEGTSGTEITSASAEDPFVLTGEEVTYVPDEDYNGPDDFDFEANDGAADSAAAEVSITVTPVNDAPVATDSSASMDEDGAPIEVDFGALVSDKETSVGDLTYTVVSGPTAEQGTLGGSGPILTFDPVDDYSGTVEISYTVTDRGDPDDCGASSASCVAARTSEQKTVTIAVAAVNDAPVAKGDSYRVKRGKKLTVLAPGILGNDADAEGDTLAARAISGPRKGTLRFDSSDGSFTYEPKRNSRGVDTFVYEASDGKGGTVTAKVKIKIKAGRR